MVTDSIVGRMCLVVNGLILGNTSLSILSPTILYVFNFSSAGLYSGSNIVSMSMLDCSLVKDRPEGTEAMGESTDVNRRKKS